MAIVVRTDDGVGRVGIAHWWPGRSYYSFAGTMISYNSPFPSYILRRSGRVKTKYMTMVRVTFEDGELATYAMCCPKDQPSRAAGRFIALLRMARLLKSMGLKMERA